MAKRTQEESGEPREGNVKDATFVEAQQHRSSAEQIPEAETEFQKRAGSSAQEAEGLGADPEPWKADNQAAQGNTACSPSSYRAYVIAGVLLVGAVVLYWAFRPRPKKRLLWRLFS